MNEIQPMKSVDRRFFMKRREFIKIPVLNAGILFGSAFLPPWTKTAFSATENLSLNLEGSVRVGISGITFPIPSFIIKKIVSSGIKEARKKVSRFSDLKRQIHHWVVKEIPGRKTPVLLPEIAEHFDQDITTIESIVQELEDEKTFLFRNRSEGINWAYPVTLDSTPHTVTFSSGETVNSA